MYSISLPPEKHSISLPAAPKIPATTTVFSALSKTIVPVIAIIEKLFWYNICQILTRYLD